MQMRPQIQLQAVIKALSDVVLPAIDPDNKLDTNGISATLTADTPLGQFKSISAYRDFEAVTYNDLDFTPYLLFANNHPEFSQHQYSQEFQLVGSTANGRIDYVTGLYYFEEKGLERIYNQVITAFNATTNPGALAQDIFRKEVTGNRDKHRENDCNQNDLGASFGGSAGADRMSFALRSLSYPDLLDKAVAGPSLFRLLDETVPGASS